MTEEIYPEKQTLARNIVRRRKDLGIGQRELARLSGVGRVFVMMIETGSANPSLEKICKLCRVLKISVSDLLRDDEP